MKICVVGTGYVGLVTGAVFADLGNDVVCVDKDASKIAELAAGRMPIYEPGLEEMVGRNVADGRLAFTDRPGRAVDASAIVFIAVGTPPKANGQADLCAVEDGRAGHRPGDGPLQGGRQQVHGPGGHRRVRARGHRAPPDPARSTFDVVSNPEFLREGSAIEDFLRPDRVVIGAPTQQVAMTLLELYAPLERPDDHHGRPLGGDDQVRLERVPRHQDLVHQRDRQHLRAGGRRRHAR